MKTNQLIKTIVCAFVAATLSTGAQAQITWSAPQAITSDDGTTDVSTQGTEVDGIRAYSDNNLSDFPNLTLNNGVVFNGTTYSTGGSTPDTIQDSSGDIVVNASTNGFAGGTGNTAVGNYQALLNLATYSTSSGTIDFNNLTVGHQYQVQVFVSIDGGASYGSHLDGTDPISLTGADTATGGTNGTYATGTFTAGTTSLVEDFSVTPYAGGSADINGNNFTYLDAPINAVQLRDITVADIPEPSTVALIGLGALGVAFLVRRRRTA